MAESTGMVIPKATSTGVAELESIDLSTQIIESILTRYSRIQKKTMAKDLSARGLLDKHNKRIESYTKPDPKQETVKKKLNKYYQKWFLQKDFLKSLGGFFKKLIDRAGGWLIDLLKVLLFFAFFDPKGTFLNSIINFLIGILETVLSTIIKWLPVIAVRMWNLFWDVLVPGFGRLGGMIGEQLFGAKSVMVDVLGALGKLFPILVVIGGIISFLWPVLAFFATTLLANQFAALSAATTFGAMAVALWSIIWPIALVVLGIAAVIASIYLLVKYWPKIKEIFFAVVDWFKNIGSIIGKAFKTFGKWVYKGFVKIKNIIWNAIISFIKKISLKTLLIGLFLGLPGLLVLALKTFGPALLQFLGGLLKKLWPKGFDGLMKVIDWISNVISDMTAYLSAFFSDPLAYINPLASNGQARRDAAFTGAKTAQAYASGDEKLIQAAKTSGVSNEVLKRGDTSEIAKVLLAMEKNKTEEGMAKTRQQVTTSIKTAKDFRTNKERKNG